MFRKMQGKNQNKTILNVKIEKLFQTFNYKRTSNNHTIHFFFLNYKLANNHNYINDIIFVLQEPVRVCRFHHQSLFAFFPPKKRV